jgi:hypothetical protein
MQQNYASGQHPATYPYTYGQTTQNGAAYASTAGQLAPFPMRRPQHSRAIPPGSTAQYAIAPSNDPDAYDEEPRAARPRRRQTQASAQARNPPLKSAMKKSAWKTVEPSQDNVRRSRTAAGNETTLFSRGRRGSGFIPDAKEDIVRRQRTTSDPMRGRASSLTRPRSRSQPRQHYTPSEYNPPDNDRWFHCLTHVRPHGCIISWNEQIEAFER